MSHQENPNTYGQYAERFGGLGVRARTKSILESVQDVRAYGPFFDVRCATALLHTFWDKITR